MESGALRGCSFIQQPFSAVGLKVACNHGLLERTLRCVRWSPGLFSASSTLGEMNRYKNHLLIKRLSDICEHAVPNKQKIRAQRRKMSLHLGFVDGFM